jgi:hypothetical protein
MSPITLKNRKTMSNSSEIAIALCKLVLIFIVLKMMSINEAHVHNIWEKDEAFVKVERWLIPCGMTITTTKEKVNVFSFSEHIVVDHYYKGVDKFRIGSIVN